MLHRGGPYLVVQGRLVQRVLVRELERVGSSIHCKLKYTFATYVSNNCNICNIQIKHLQHSLEQVKYLEHALATYVYSHCNICIIYIKHMQHPDKALAT
jgi:hypothetical protein